MKKSIMLISLLGVMPIACLADSYDNKIAELTRKKQAKMEELDKCAGVKKSLQIAGVSTLGITVAGVASNITEAATLKKKNAELDSLQKEIDTTNEKINKKKLEIAEKERLAQQQEQQMLKLKDNLKYNNVVSSDTCTCDNNSGGAYCSLDDITRTKCMIRACKDSNKVPDEKGEKCVDKTDDNLIITQIDGNIDIVANQNKNEIDLTKLTFKQKCEALNGGENGYTGGYFTENGTEYCTPYNWDDESIVTKLCNDLGVTKCRTGKEIDRWTCTTGNTCSMFNNTYPDIPSDELAREFNLSLPDCSQEQLDSLSAGDGVYRNGSCEVISCKNGLPINDDGTCSLE